MALKFQSKYTGREIENILQLAAGLEFDNSAVVSIEDLNNEEYLYLYSKEGPKWIAAKTLASASGTGTSTYTGGEGITVDNTNFTIGLKTIDTISSEEIEFDITDTVEVIQNIEFDNYGRPTKITIGKINLISLIKRVEALEKKAWIEFDDGTGIPSENLAIGGLFFKIAEVDN